MKCFECPKCRANGYPAHDECRHLTKAAPVTEASAKALDALLEDAGAEAPAEPIAGPAQGSGVQ